MVYSRNKYANTVWERALCVKGVSGWVIDVSVSLNCAFAEDKVTNVWSEKTLETR